MSNDKTDLLLKSAEALARAYNQHDPVCPLCGGPARAWDPRNKGTGHREGCLIRRLIAARTPPVPRPTENPITDAAELILIGGTEGADLIRHALAIRDNDPANQYVIIDSVRPSIVDVDTLIRDIKESCSPRPVGLDQPASVMIATRRNMAFDRFKIVANNRGIRRRFAAVCVLFLHHHNQPPSVWSA